MAHIEDPSAAGAATDHPDTGGYTNEAAVTQTGMAAKRGDMAARRGILLAAVVAALGFGMIFLGYLLQGNAYFPGLLQQVGSELMLAIPMLYLGRIFESRLRQTEENTRVMSGNIAEVRAKLDETVAQLEVQTWAARERLQQDHNLREETFEHARTNPEYSTIAALLQDATRIRAIAADGVRVRVPGSQMRVCFIPPSEVKREIAIQVQDRLSFSSFADFPWRPGESKSVLARHVAAVIRSAGHAGTAGQIPAQIDVVAILRDLAKTIYTAVAARTGESPHDLGRVIEIPNTQWAVTADGVRCLDRSYLVPASQFDTKGEDWRSATLSKPWVRRAEFIDAYEIAVALARHI
jgi:hypothetical protein